MELPQCIGAKHSSLSRQLEWDRLALRDATRPDFHVFTGNDLAIDMVMYGSDYLLGLSTFAPEEFAAARPHVGDGRSRRSTSSTTCSSTSVRSRSATRCRRTGTTPRCASSCAAGPRPTRPRSARSRRPDADRDVLWTLAERLDALEATRP